MLIITLVRADDAKQLISLNIFRNKLVLKLLLFGNGSLSSDGFLAKKKKLSCTECLCLWWSNSILCDKIDMHEVDVSLKNLTLHIIPIFRKETGSFYLGRPGMAQELL